MNMAVDIFRVLSGVVGILAIVYAAGKLTGGLREFRGHVTKEMSEVRNDVQKIQADLNNGIKAKVGEAASSAMEANSRCASLNDSMRGLHKDVKQDIEKLRNEFRDDVKEVHTKVNTTAEQLAAVKATLGTRPCIAQGGCGQEDKDEQTK